MSGKSARGPGCHGDRTTGLFPEVVRSGNRICQKSGKISQKHKITAPAGKTKVSLQEPRGDNRLIQRRGLVVL